MKSFIVKCLVFTLFLFLLGETSADARKRGASGPSKHRGPLNVSNSFPATLFFLNYRPLKAENLEKGDYQILFDIDESNTIVSNRSHSGLSSVLLDSELTQYRFDLSTGITDKLELGISTAILHYHGGFLDGFIDFVEETVSKPSHSRTLRPVDAFRINLIHNNEVWLDMNGSAAGIGDTTLRAKLALMEEKSLTSMDLSTRFEIKTPTGDESKGMGSGSFDFGISLLAHKSFGNFHIQADFAYMFLGELKLGSGYKPDNVFTAIISTEYSWRKTSLILQFISTQTALRNVGIPVLEEGGDAVVLGFKYDLPRNFVLQASMTENITDVTFADYSINAGIEYRFGKKKGPAKKRLAKKRLSRKHPAKKHTSKKQSRRGW